MIKALLERSGITGRGFLSKKQIQSAWNQGDYATVAQSCEAFLSHRPMDPYHLTFSGFSSFYLAMSRVSDEEQMKDLHQSVARLRKALILPRLRMRREIEYILGKTYFHLGYYYYDQSIERLESAAQQGFSSSDLNEYLALSYYGIAKYSQSIVYFNKVLEGNRTDQLLIATALAYYKNADSIMASKLLEEAIEITADIAADHKARFILSEIFIQSGALARAEEQLSSIIKADEQSAEANYMLGIISQKKGDLAKARAYWRKAIKLDPMHQAARQMLNDKTNTTEVRS